MKKFFGLYDKDEEKRLKDKIISFTTIPSKFVNFLEVHVDNEEYLHVIHIDTTTDGPHKKDLVLLHGFAGSSLNYFKIFERLSESYSIYAIDLPGMGCSSRHYISDSASFSDVEDYFLSRLKICFDKLKLNHFVLCAHSFGGYIASLYTLRHTHMIEDLILLSPVGLSSSYSEIKSTTIEDMMQQMCFKMEKSPAFIFKLFGGIVSNFLFDHVCSQEKFRGLKVREEFETNRDLLRILMRNTTGSENAIFTFFNRHLQAYKPLTYYYEVLREVRMLILYGGDDWCPKSQAEDLQSLLPDTVEINVVSDSGHLMYYDNYEELTDKIMSFIDRQQ